MEAAEIISKLAAAYCQVIGRDRHLLKVRANERSIAHRFAIYIEPLFPGYDVDCDYNKNLENTKRSPSYSHQTWTGRDSDLVIPDIIIHRRNTQDNLVVIELKPTNRAEYCTAGLSTVQPKCLCDCCKLKAIKRDLGYSNAFYIVFPVGAKLRNFNLSRLHDYIKAIS